MKKSVPTEHGGPSTLASTLGKTSDDEDAKS
jgi:hypothetical protein